MPSKIRGLKRVNLTIEGELHRLAKRRANKLGLHDGFSGYVARLVKLDIKRKRKRLGSMPRLLGESNS